MRHTHTNLQQTRKALTWRTKGPPLKTYTIKLWHDTAERTHRLMNGHHPTADPHYRVTLLSTKGLITFKIKRCPDLSIRLKTLGSLWEKRNTFLTLYTKVNSNVGSAKLKNGFIKHRREQAH